MKVETDAVLVVFLKVSRDGAEVTSATRKARRLADGMCS